MKISDSKFVTVTYDLYVGEGDERELMESATSERPLEFVFGTNSMIKAFEDNLYGLAEGDTFKFTIEQDDAYGEYDVEFLYVLMELLAVQEKTNRADAYMFGKIIEELLESDRDIFKIVSTAGFGGRRG